MNYCLTDKQSTVNNTQNKITSYILQKLYLFCEVNEGTTKNYSVFKFYLHVAFKSTIFCGEEFTFWVGVCPILVLFGVLT